MAEAKSECEDLMNAALPFAEQMLAEHGEFYPFGMVLTREDENAGISGYSGDERPPSSEVIGSIKWAFARGARQAHFRATALVYDVRVVVPATDETSDAVAFALDHRDKYSVVVFVPYKLAAGSPVFGEVFAQQGEGEIFRKPKRPWWHVFPSR